MMGMQEEQEKMKANNSMQNINNGGVMFEKVMTDKQLETLRKQIAVYSIISENLIVMHNNLISQQHLTGVRLENFEHDPNVTSAGKTIGFIPRWKPTPIQLKTLQHNFEEGNENPSKLKVKELISELSQHGPISEKNIYNWYQNCRAKSRRKQRATIAALKNNNNNNAESSLKYEKTKPHEDFHFPNNDDSAALNYENMCFESPDISSSLYFPQLPSYDDLLSSTEDAEYQHASF